jgi:hydrogenase 3 maturation protease
MENENDFEEKLKAWLFGAEKVAIVGVGNTLRRDDAAGVEVVKLMQGKVSSKVSLIEAETMPENYIDTLVNLNPSHIQIVDSGLIGKKPGDAQLLAANETMITPISTHMLPLQILCAYLEKTINAKILLLIIQPKDIGMREGLTRKIAKTAERIAGFLIETLP